MGMWKVISNLLDIDFIHSDIHTAEFCVFKSQNVDCLCGRLYSIL